MKTHIILSALLAFATSVNAANDDDIELARSHDNTEVYYGHPSTVKVFKDGVSLMVTKKVSKGNKGYTYSRIYHAITDRDCNQGYGTLYARLSEADQWEAFVQVRVNSPNSIGDYIASEMCNAAQIVKSNKGKTSL